jgi:FkbM family methyltransferase
MALLRKKIVAFLNRNFLSNTNHEISDRNKAQILRKNLPNAVNNLSKITLSRSTIFTPKALVDKYGIPVFGILHVGAHKGEEVKIYKGLGIKHGVFIEPISENYAELCNQIEGFGDYQAFQMAAGDKDTETTIFCASNDLQSSSLLKPVDHLTQNPEITFDSTELVKMKRLDSLNLSKHLNFWVIDVQGFELAVLTGAGSQLDFCDYLYIELNRANVYDECAKVEEIDDFLSNHGFKRVITRWWDIWGDGFYVRGNKLPLRAINSAST